MAENDLVTVYRSADTDAEDDAGTARDLLRDAGLSPVLCGDDTPGVVEGSWEVRVPPDQAARAEQVLAENLEEVELHVDPSHDLDPVTIFRSEANTTAEMEAYAIRSILDANGIDAVVVGNSALPNLAFEVRVPKELEEQARAILAEAQAAGPAAAEEAEQAAEDSSGE